MPSQSQSRVPLLTVLQLLCCVRCCGKKLSIYEDFQDTLRLTVHSLGETQVDLYASKDSRSNQSRLNALPYRKEIDVSQSQASRIFLQNESSMKALEPRRTMNSSTVEFAKRRGRELGTEAHIHADRNASERSLLGQSRMDTLAHMKDVLVTQYGSSTIALHSGSSMKASSPMRGRFISKVGRFARNGVRRIGLEEPIIVVRNASGRSSPADRSEINISARMQEKVAAKYDASRLASTSSQDFGIAHAPHSIVVGSFTQLWQKGCELRSRAQMPLPIFICLVFLLCCFCSVFLQCFPSRNSRKRRYRTLSKETIDPNDDLDDSSPDEVISDQAWAQRLQRQAKLAVIKREKQCRREKLEKQHRGAQSSGWPNGSYVVGTVAAPMPKKVRHETVRQ